METAYALVLTTVESYLTAVQIAKILVTERLAACCTILPNAISFFEWEGKLDERKENVVLIKTTKNKIEPLKDRLAELHPDEVPEIIALKIEDGLEAYLLWVKEMTK
ncbi:MAG: divalent-cation tolerance protein CutA [Candidatus Kapaibacteriota bacterium]